MGAAASLGLVLLLGLAQPPVPTPSEMGRSVAPLVESVKDAVVTIRSTKIIKRAVREDPISQFFRDRMGIGGPAPRSETQQGLGSGFIIDAKGVVLTNNHVVAGADEVQVVTSDGRVVDAKVLGSDPGTDVAVVQMQRAPSTLKVARLGDSDKVRVGDYVLAIGNPLGLGQTVTMGIVSAKNRGLEGKLVDYADFIQTDAAINQGNSGGPLFNFAGEVVGINSAILNPAMAMNVGFAIPINLAKNIADQLRTKGRVGRGFLGVTTAPFGVDQARQQGVTFEPGALVNVVTPKTPAEAAGIKPNDLIVEVGGRRIDGPGSLTQAIASRRPGETVPLVVVRKGQRVNLQVRLGENIYLAGQDVLGMRVRLLQPPESSALGIPENTGLHVIGVDPRGAVSGSLQEGDVVVAISSPRKAPATVESLRNFEARIARGGHGQLVIVREGEPFALNF
jgi:Do/DeqQ family serine protease